MIDKLVYEFFNKNFNLYFLSLLTHLRIPIKSLAIPHYYGKLTSILKDGNMKEIKHIFFILIILWCSVQILAYLSSLIQSKLKPKLIRHIRIEIIKKIIYSLKNNYFDIEIGRFLTKIINSPFTIRYGLEGLAKFFTDSIFIVISTFIYLFFQNYYIALIYLICISLVACITMFYFVKCELLVIDAEKSYDDTHEIIEDTFSNLISIYSSNKINNEIKKLDKENKKTEDKEYQMEYYNSKFKLIYSITYIIIFIILNYFTFNLYRKRKITSSILISIVIINYSILTEFMDLYYNIKNLINSKGELEILKRYLDDLPDSEKSKKIKKYDTELVFKEKFINLKIKNLYYNIDDKQILNGISFNIKRKEKTAICGNIGSGKSTIAKIIVGLIPNFKGEILINDKSLNSLNIDKMREFITYIPQHPKLFNRTLFDNITYGTKNTKLDDIYNILDKLDFIDIKHKFQDMMYKKVGKNGSYLSGGQRQIVYLIRALLKNNRLIIMDEPTSSLDNEIKQKVIKLIDEISKNKNVLIITHDLELLNNMDKVIILKKGKVIKESKITTDNLNEIKNLLNKK